MISRLIIALLLFTVQFNAHSQGKKALHGELSLSYPVGTDTSSVNILFDYYDNNDLAYRDSVNRKILEFVKLITINETKSNVRIPDQEFIRSSAEEFKKSQDELIEEDYFNPWFLDASVQIREHKKYVTLMLHVYDYTGGAHPNNSVEYFHFDKKTGQRLYLKDFFSNVDELTVIAEPFFRKERDLPLDADLSEEGFWFVDNTFHLNENFYFVKGDLMIFYNNYEVTAYAMGPTEFKIPKADIAQLFIRKP